jgi:hypothetical protein
MSTPGLPSTFMAAGLHNAAPFCNILSWIEPTTPVSPKISAQDWTVTRLALTLDSH